MGKTGVVGLLRNGAGPKPPEITPLDRFDLLSNDAEATRRVVEAFRAIFPAARIQQTKPISASEDFGSFASEWHAPSVFWFVGGIDEQVYAKARESGKFRKSRQITTRVLRP